MFSFFRDRQNQARPDNSCCEKCGKTLSSSGVYRMEGKKVCTDCYKRFHPYLFCNVCGKEEPLYFWKGKRYCGSCYRAALDRKIHTDPIDLSAGAES